MANLTAYPIGTPKSGDLIIGTSVPIPGTNQKSTTKNFSINEVVTLATENYVEVTKQLTNAQWLALKTTSIEIVPAQGAGTVVQVLTANHLDLLNTGTAFLPPIFTLAIGEK